MQCTTAHTQARLLGLGGIWCRSLFVYACEPSCKVDTFSLALPLSQTAYRPVGRLLGEKVET